MSAPVRIAIVDPDPDTRLALRRSLAGIPSVVVTGEYSSVGEAPLTTPDRRPDVLVVPVPPDASVKTVEQLSKALPDTAILATGPGGSADFAVQVIRAGAFEFLPRPIEPAHFLAALNKVSRLRRDAAPPPRSGRIVSFFSTKGGLGVTTLAINLGVCFAERAPGVTLLVELDARHSDVTTFLDLRPKYSVLDAFENIERLDDSFLRGLLATHPSGLSILPGPARVERVHLTVEQVQAGLEILRFHFEHVFLDLRHDMAPSTIAALEASDTILFLTSPNVSALRSGAAGLAAFRHLGIDLQKVQLVVMREGTGEDVTLKHVRDTLGLPIFWKTPSDYPSVLDSINSGRPVVTAQPKSKIAKNIRQLTELMSEPARPEAARRATSLLGLVLTPKTLTGAG